MRCKAPVSQERWYTLIVHVTSGLLTSMSLCPSTQVFADIRFDEVTQAVGIDHSGTTWGASWGDVDNDGWPDLWIGNHDTKPTLYVNRQGKRFVNVIDEVWAGDQHADTHGAAWADFDNDGDQDLVELVDARLNEDGTFCLGCGRNHLFVNENGLLLEQAKQLGLDSVGYARSPLWFDADRDGRLDVLVVNSTPPWKPEPPSAIFHQGSSGFKESNEDFHFRDQEWTRREQYWALLRNALRLNFRGTSLLNMSLDMEFAQLANLSGDEELELILFSTPTRMYSIRSKPFADLTAVAGFPAVDLVSDVAIEDFTGDGKLDMYLARGERRISDVVQVNSNEIWAALKGGKTKTGGRARAVFFHTQGEIELQIYPMWLSLSKVFIGHVGRHPSARTISLSPEDSEVRGPESTTTPQSGAISVTFDPEARVWTLRSLNEYVDFIVRSKTPITKVGTFGFESFKGKGTVDTLLIRQEDEFVQKKLTGESGAPTACHSVGAGDFDNDMDVDLYLVCEGPVKNLPNRLLENDGQGNFRLVPNAGGASGSHLGRGDVVAIADYDRDGLLDLFITNGADPTSPFVANGPHQLFRNHSNDNHWLEIDLEGVQSNRDGIGASITLEAGGVRQIREQRGGMHRLTQNHKRLHFGLGPNSVVDKLTVRWPSGFMQEIRNVGTDRILRVREEVGMILR